MKKRIVIAGGGFAGLYAAKHLDKTIARHADVEVVLISNENFTLFTPLLHEVAAGDLYPGDIINPLRRILRHVMVVEAEAETIDLNTRTISCRAVPQIQPPQPNLLSFFLIQSPVETVVASSTFLLGVCLRQRAIA
jgi:NADH dehydrogenase FAD-containing subunit